MKGLTREWRCWREDGSYYGPCPPIGEPWEHEVWREDRHGDCGWQLYVMEADLNGVPMRLIPDNAETVERIAETICRIDNQTGPEVAVEGIPCDLHRSVAASVLAALDGETP